SIAPVNRTTLLPLTEWAVNAADGASVNDDEAAPWENPSYFGPRTESGQSSLFELAESSLRPIVFLDEPAALRAAAAKHWEAATENYERNAQANAPTPDHYLWTEAQFAAALAKGSQINLEQLALTIGETPQFALPSRPSPRFHGDVVACMSEAKTQIEAGGTV